MSLQLPTVSKKARSLAVPKDISKKGGPFRKKWKAIINGHKQKLMIEMTGTYMDEKLLDISRVFGDPLTLTTIAFPVENGDREAFKLCGEAQIKYERKCDYNEQFARIVIPNANIRQGLTVHCNNNGMGLLLLAWKPEEVTKRRSGATPAAGSFTSQMGASQAGSQPSRKAVSEPLWKTLRRVAGSVLVAKESAAHKTRGDLENQVYVCYVNGTPAGDCSYKFAKKVLKEGDQLHVLQVHDRFGTSPSRKNQKADENYQKFVEEVSKKKRVHIL